MTIRTCKNLLFYKQDLHIFTGGTHIFCWFPQPAPITIIMSVNTLQNQEMKLMLFGQSHTSIDGNGRIAIPATLSANLSKCLFITQGLDRDLYLLSEDAFQILYEQLLKLNLADPKARLLLRVILGTASEAVLDSTNHLEIPENLKDFASLDTRAVLVGKGNYIEIWNPEHWNEQEQFFQDVETDPGRYSSFNIAFG